MVSVSMMKILLYAGIIKKEEIWDVIFPHLPLVRLTTAQIFRDISLLVTDPKSRDSIHSISKELFSESVEELTDLWDTDEVLGIHPEPWVQSSFKERLGIDFQPWIDDSWKERLGVRPEPWIQGSATEQIVLASIITSLTEVSILGKFSNQLKEAAYNIVGSAAPNLVKEFSISNCK